MCIGMILGIPLHEICFFKLFQTLITGAGLALITLDDARLWTDGRYFLQASQQLSEHWKLMRIGEDPVVEIWTAEVC